MLFFHVQRNLKNQIEKIFAFDSYPKHLDPLTIVDRHNWHSLAEAEEIAKAATHHISRLYIAIDNGPHHYPRYDVIEAPKVGDEVSYGFNGDYYPCGKIVKISKTLKQVTTDQGQKFYRKGKTGRWLMNGTWSMVRGHRDERNPSF